MLQVQGNDEQFAAAVTDNDSSYDPEADPEARGGKRRCLVTKCFNGNNGGGENPKKTAKCA